MIIRMGSVEGAVGKGAAGRRFVWGGGDRGFDGGGWVQPVSHIKANSQAKFEIISFFMGAKYV